MRGRHRPLWSRSQSHWGWKKPSRIFQSKLCPIPSSAPNCRHSPRKEKWGVPNELSQKKSSACTGMGTRKLQPKQNKWVFPGTSSLGEQKTGLGIFFYDDEDYFFFFLQVDWTHSHGEMHILKNLTKHWKIYTQTYIYPGFARSFQLQYRSLLRVMERWPPELQHNLDSCVTRRHFVWCKISFSIKAHTGLCHPRMSTDPTLSPSAGQLPEMNSSAWLIHQEAEKRRESEVWDPCRKQQRCGLLIWFLRNSGS